MRKTLLLKIMFFSMVLALAGGLVVGCPYSYAFIDAVDPPADPAPAADPVAQTIAPRPPEAAITPIVAPEPLTVSAEAGFENQATFAQAEQPGNQAGVNIEGATAQPQEQLDYSENVAVDKDLVAPMAE